MSGDTFSSIKAHRRKATQPMAMILPIDPADHSITFHSSEAKSLSCPYDDAMVLTLNISNCEVSRIMTRLLEMEIDESEVEKSSMVLIGFNEESTVVIEMIKLPIFAAGENKLTNFLVRLPIGIQYHFGKVMDPCNEGSPFYLPSKNTLPDEERNPRDT